MALARPRIGSTTLAPSSPSGTRTPSRSSTVGRRSTERTCSRTTEPASVSSDGAAWTDGFYFASRPLGGDGEIVAHVASMTNTHVYAKAGVMIRDTTGASSAHVTLSVKPNGAVE